MDNAQMGIVKFTFDCSAALAWEKEKGTATIK